MTKENPFENWTYVPAESKKKYDFKKKIFNTVEIVFPILYS